MQQPQHWIATRGQFTYEDGLLTYLPPATTAAEPGAAPAYGEARSNIAFQSGSIAFEVRTHEPDARCRIVLDGGGSKEIHVGLLVGSSAYGITLYQNDKWESVKTVGYGTRAPAEQWHQLRVEVAGSTIRLFCNGVRLLEHNEVVQKGQLAIYMSGTQPVEARHFEVTAVVPTAFVVMQFTEDYNALFTDVIKPTFEDFGFRVVRGDDSAFSGMVMNDVARAIREASVVIADITPDNPNVFYEVGFAHALDKPTILLSDRRREKLPFDVSGFRTLFYDNTIGGKGVVEARLREHLKAITG